MNAAPSQPSPPKDDASPYSVPAGKVIVIHARWVYGKGAEECIGLFRTTREYRPVEEHAEYIRQNPAVDPDPTKWDRDARNAFLRWEIDVRKSLEDAAPFYLFLEPFPETPKEGVAPQ